MSKDRLKRSTQFGGAEEVQLRDGFTAVHHKGGDHGLVQFQGPHEA